MKPAEKRNFIIKCVFVFISYFFFLSFFVSHLASTSYHLLKRSEDKKLLVTAEKILAPSRWEWDGWGREGGRESAAQQKIKIIFSLFQCRALSRESVVVIKILKLILIQIERLFCHLFISRRLTDGGEIKLYVTLTPNVCDSNVYCAHHFQHHVQLNFYELSMKDKTNRRKKKRCEWERITSV